MSKQATFGGGCFWCIEAALEELEGVTDITSGYAGGSTENPSYRQVCDGNTGHAEVVCVTYDEDTLTYGDLLEVFFTVHDPTTLNRQGPDVGSQYRSIVLAHNDEQLELAEAFVTDLEEQGVFEDDIVTEIELLETFYEAEEHHQDYYENNPEQAYCTMNVAPKIEKVREQFAERVQ